MNPPDHQAEAIWERTLPHIRAARRSRAYRRIAVATAAFGIVPAVWLTLQTGESTDSPAVRFARPAPVIETIAVMRIDDHGTIRLEEIATDELGTIELTLGQAPLISHDLSYW